MNFLLFLGLVCLLTWVAVMAGQFIGKRFLRRRVNSFWLGVLFMVPIVLLLWLIAVEGRSLSLAALLGLLGGIWRGADS